MLERIATTPRSPVLFLGETGVGKEVLARELHRQAAGEAAPFVHVNCAALPESTVESELFGHEKGAFTDARTTRRGLVEVASGGTLFLDEVGELPLALQAKLLTFLDAGRFRRLGGSERADQHRAHRRRRRTAISQAAIARGYLPRGPLVPSLGLPHRRAAAARAPGGRAPARRGHRCTRSRAELGRRGVVLGARARERLLRYPFPGNVRELRNVLERAIVLEPGPELELGHLDALAGRVGRRWPPSRWPARRSRWTSSSGATPATCWSAWAADAWRLPRPSGCRTRRS